MAYARRRSSETVCYLRSSRQRATVLLTLQAAIGLAFEVVHHAGAKACEPRS